MAGTGLKLADVYDSAELSIPVDRVIALLAAEISVEKVADFAARIEAARRYDSANTERRNYWAELAIWSSRRLGELIRAAQEAKLLADGKTGRPQKASHDATLTLADIGIDRDASSRAQKLADIPEEKITAFVEQAKASGEEVSKAAAIRFATGTEKASTAAHVSRNTGIPEWYTPDEYLVAVREVLGEIELDPATADAAQTRVQAKRFHTLADDGLTKKWKGRVFLNPPYTAGLVDKFVGKLVEHVGGGTVPEAIVLVNNATDTGWLQDAAVKASVVCFPRGRIKFLDEDGRPGAPLQGQCVLYFGDNGEKFADVFGQFGFCAEVCA